ncbi:GNAT family N-acetyltransferase [Streptomyces axinellae]|uniref:N-acetyltransferase domain-containing protein n=1 Tax=Streptomyces axinellae TaxID=552788 RepID=A0ABN3QRZ4_9ACTN
MVGVNWTISPAPIAGPEALATVRAYLDDIISRYYGRPATAEEIDQTLAEERDDELAPPTGRFLLARAEDEGAVAGCAGVRMLDEKTAELRRVWVVPQARGNGLGTRLVAAAEHAAVELGAAAIRLDTRSDLVEARRLYARRGYEDIPAYNDSPYAGHWLEKRLAGAPASRPATALRR